MASVRETPMLQASVKDSNLPVEIRLNFVKKVYGILMTMLVVSFGIASPFVFQRDDTLRFMDENSWILGVVAVLLLVHQLVNLAICFEACCGGGPCMRAYLRMFIIVPWNYVFVMSYAVCIGVLLGFVCASYKAQSVVLVFILTAGIMAALTIYAVTSKTDFTGYGMYLFAAVVGLMLFGVVACFFPHDSLVHKAMAAAFAVLMCFFIVYDTQLIFGTASLQFGRSATRKIEFTLDMYCFAAYQLYLDFINLFLHLLSLFGERR